MVDKAVELSVAGQTCRVFSSADEQELAGLAAMVESKLGDVWDPRRPVSTKAVLLAAMALAHDAKAERQRADAIVEKAKTALVGLLGRVDGVLESTTEAEVPAAPLRRRPAKRSAKRKHLPSDGDGDGGGNGGGNGKR